VTHAPIADLTPFTQLDYPGRLACIVWFSGCNMRCPYCHNPELVPLRQGRIGVGELLEFLRRRSGLLDGVVLSGGEATLHDLAPLCREIVSLGYSVKLDTNGSRPDRLLALADAGLLERVALDFKAPAASFRQVTGRGDFDAFARSLRGLLERSIPLEVRTTVHSELHTPDTIRAMIRWLRREGYQGVYRLQEARIPPEGTLGAVGPSAFDRKALGAFDGVQWRDDASGSVASR